MSSRISPLHLALLLATGLVFAWSAWHPYDRLTWWLEVAPGILAAAILVAPTQFFPLPTHADRSTHHAARVGGHYTYVASFFTDRTVFRMAPVIISIGSGISCRACPGVDRARAVHSAARGHVHRLALCHRASHLYGISALYELLEWATALGAGAASTVFLGTQGYVWETQKDMFMALIGAICALILLSRWQNRQIRHLPRQW
jgi:putative membrane protein